MVEVERKEQSEASDYEQKPGKAILRRVEMEC